MSKIIAIFCDGTWNSPTIPEPTNVDECFKAAAATDTQHTIYISGVGAGKAGGALRTLVNKIGGGAFGWGLNKRIRQGYEAIVRDYEPGDRIMVFGFSRGAYTARSLVGMIRKCGIMEKEKLNLLTMNTAFRLYRRGGPENAPDKPHIIAERKKLSPRFATSKADLDSRTGEAHMVNVSFLGVWDTVGSLGLPEPLLGRVAKFFNRRYQFHDTDLSSMVSAARHAVALDERRVLFKPSLWSNLGPHRRPDGTESLGLNQGTTGDQRPFQQLWFIGNHGVVGGSSEMHGLVAIARDWVLEGAKERGLQTKSTAAFSLPNPLEEGNAGSAPGVYDVARSLLEWREGPEDIDDVHPSVPERVRGVPEYRPETLALVMEENATRFA
ncbi:MAG: DUF2235 domain-containing protein [Pseudomonadota bacterium]